MNKLTVGFFSLLAALFFSLIVTSATYAQQSKPFQLSLTPNIAIHNRNVPIEGLSLNVWGENPQEGLALGIVNGSTGDSAGFSWAWLLNYADNYKGVHWAYVNYTKGNFLGWQSGLINYTDKRLKGVQTGLINYAREFKGVQLGLANFAETATTGLQLGIVNVISENRWFTEFPDAVAPGMVFVNWRF
ncbi:MAG: LA_2272 family surface repeat-containing protein [Desulfurivibrionaceae bacterium]